MKKIHVMIAINIIILIGLLTIIINKKNKEYIIQDGIMLALTLDGEKIKSYPEGTNYGVDVDCENGKGKWLVEEWKLSIEEVTGNVICNIDFKTNPKTLKSEVEEVNKNNNYNGHGYRYSGKHPNNYIWFNNEVWRIIGSIPTCLEASCGTNTTNLVKIIRENTIGGYSYDAISSGYTGAWGSNTLYNLLNTHYYSTNLEGLNGQSHAGCYGYYLSNKYYTILSKNNCDYTNIGILSSTYYGKMVENVYWNTGATSPWGTVTDAYSSEITKRTVNGYVGLINVSDYGYAASSQFHSTTMTNYSSNTTGNYGILEITKTNWLYDFLNLWSINQNVESASESIFIYGVLSHEATFNGRNVRPVVYLDPSVYVVSGDGTEANPYQVGM